ncbi:DNA topoisomerase 1 [Paraburkholderia domus]|uniref:DNA topoisomerase n=1 Tax=Paraburkholderia domus TaxID=2793075 RepID=UPI001912AC4E|nr:DNA topoisomerase [Paraburkholderia domus]MBK5051749.1 type IA DNA topoisomerase [Burkholderia sp. R-70006]CAE6794656.1 DNA topoisomerase 1 [Paraburkholderia domus]
MRNLVIVEAAGKVDALRSRLKSIGLHADVVATVGHVADNPRSLNPIELDSDLRETAYAFREDRQGVIDKIRRAAFGADRIYVATDDDQEGDVIAHDVARLLSDYADHLYRVRLRALTESELKESFGGTLSRDFDVPAHHGICRRIVDRAIGAAFTLVDEHSAIPVGRVQSSLLASLKESPPDVGHFNAAIRMTDGKVLWANIPVATKAGLDRASELAELAAQGRVKLLEAVERDEPVARPWGYEEVIAEASIRLHVDLYQAADVFQQAYERGLVTYPRVRANGFTRDAVEIAAALAEQNRCGFDGAYLPLRESSDIQGRAHECPRPVDEDMLLGRPLAVLDLPEALAVLIARNVIECGQLARVRKVRVGVDDEELTFSAALTQARKPWKTAEPDRGFVATPRPVALLRHMAREQLGRPSTVVGHVMKFMQRGLLEESAVGMTLNARGERWLAHAASVGFHPDTSARMEEAFSAPMTDPHARAREILSGHAMLDAVRNKALATGVAAVPDEACPEPF